MRLYERIQRMWKLPEFRRKNLSLAEFLREMPIAARPVYNTFTNRVMAITNGFGSALQGDTYFLNQNVALSGTGQGSTTLPSSSTWSAPHTVCGGWLRVKIYAGIGTSPTLVDLLATLSDGTTTCQIAQVHPNTAVTLSSTSIFDEIFPFYTGVTGTSITVKTTLGGTSPGATMDLEVAGIVGPNPTQS